MKQNRSTILLGLLALLAWFCCGLLAQRFSQRAPGPSIRWQDGSGVSAADWTRAESRTRADGGEGLPDAVLWRTMEGTISRTDGTRGAAPDLVQTFGDPALLWPLGFTAGNWPTRGDAEGCAVSEDVASALWGGPDVVGQTLLLEGRTYYVRGVFHGAKDLAVFQAAPGDIQVFDRLLPVLSGGPEAANALLSRAGLPRGTILDLELAAWLLSALASLPALLLGAGVMLRLLKRLLSLRSAPLLLGQFLPLAVVGGWAAMHAMGVPWSIPARLIPSRWSDFSFWTGLVRQWSESAKQLLSEPLTGWDMALWGAALGCLLLVPVTAALAIVWAKRARARSERALFLGTLSCLLAVFAAAYLGGMPPLRGMWLTPPLWLAADWCLSRHRESLKPTQEGGASHEASDPAAKAAETTRLGAGA